MTIISSGGDSPYADEEVHIERMLRGIDLAVESAIDSPGRKITRLEQEKLCYFLIQEFDVDVTYSWYLAGANTKVIGDPGPSRNRVRTTDSGLEADTGLEDDVLQYRNYLRQGDLLDGMSLRDIWYTDRFEFLETFYEEHAPEEYLQLYLASTRIREKLKNLADRIEESAGQPTLSQFGDSEPEPILSTRQEEKIRLLISDLHMEMAQIDRLSEIISPVSMGTDLIEQVLARLTEVGSLGQNQRDLLRDVFEFFFYDVWRYPALYISTQTAEGPNSMHLIEEHATLFADFHKQLGADARSLRTRCEANGLYPDLGTHSSRLDEDEMRHLQRVGHDILTASRGD